MRASLVAALALALSTGAAAKPRVPTAPKPPPHDVLAGGWHWRLATPNGPVHVWRPAGYDARTAGAVVYVHGLYTHVDEAMREHKLAEQFAASRRNALFIVPEAPASGDEAPFWKSLKALFETTRDKLHLPLPRGSLAVVGHSGAYRTIVNWLDYPAINDLVLVDALYGNEDDYAKWLQTHAGRMTLVARGTTKWTEPFVRRFPRRAVRNDIPASVEGFSKRERAARLLYLRSQYGHMELITEGKVLPVLLRRTALRPLRETPTPRPPRNTR